jgi:soluble lytic murein transglycosylase-like protein
MRNLQNAGLLLLLCAPAYACACWDDAAERYRVPAQLLIAIARVESNLNPHAINRSHFHRTGSYDIGLMQINSSNLRSLAQYGIREHDLMDACTNIHIGAWLLAHSFEQYGTTWDGVGAYNAACTQLKGASCLRARSRYAWLVYRNLPSMRSELSEIATATATLPSKVAGTGAGHMLAARVTP